MGFYLIASCLLSSQNASHRRRNEKNTIADARSVFGLRRARNCPYAYEITKDGRLIIEGEDFGNAEACFAEGRKLHELVTVWHEVSRSDAN